MNRYPETELDLSVLLKRSIRLHYLTLKHTIFFILAMTVVKYLSILLLALFPGHLVHIAVYVVAVLLIVYFFAAALLAAQRAFTDQPLSTLDAVKSVWKRILPIYGTFLAYVIGAVVVYHLGNYLVIGVEKLLHESLDVSGITLIISTAFLLVFVAMFYFSFPLSIIDEKPIHQAFYDSVLLTEKNKFGILVLFLILGATLILLIPGAMHEYFLTLYHLDAVFDFVVLCVATPIYINLLLLLINDAKKQMQ